MPIEWLTSFDTRYVTPEFVKLVAKFNIEDVRLLKTEDLLKMGSKVEISFSDRHHRFWHSPVHEVRKKVAREMV